MTLSTSDIDSSKSSAKTAFIYLLLSAICALFGAVYEYFSHEVYSYYMIYAFVFPLAGGAIPFLAISLCVPKKYPGTAARYLYHSGIATLTLGSIVRGILDIYGTTNHLSEWYWRIGVLMLTAGIFVFLFTGEKNSHVPW